MGLVYRVHGIELAEAYFDTLPDKSKTYKVYGALLNAYVLQKSVDKAEAVAQTMREMCSGEFPFPFGMLITLYSQIQDYDKIDAIVKEMAEKGISRDRKMIKALLSAYAANSAIPQMEMALEWGEKDPNIVMNWTLYSIAANGYLKVGLVDKTLPMLKKMEDIMDVMAIRSRKSAFYYLLSHWAATGMKEEVYRVWNKYKADARLFASIYGRMVISLAKVNDIEGAEKILEEWNSKCPAGYSNWVVRSLVIAYCRKGLLEKAESAVNEAVESSKFPASLWNLLAKGYERGNQMQKAVEMLKRAAVSAGKQEWSWSPCSETLNHCLDYLEGQGDMDGIEDMIKSLKNLCPVSINIYHRWLRTCIAANASVSKVLDQMQLDGISVNEETQKILQVSSDP